MTIRPYLSGDPLSTDIDTLADGGAWLLDLVAAVDHLRRGHRPDLTVWDALEEALRWSHPDPGDSDSLWDRPDPLSGTLYTFLITRTDRPVAVELQAALRRWVTVMGERYNDGHHWPHPTARRGFPPPLHTIALSSDE
jgi:hypothetical protein